MGELKVPILKTGVTDTPATAIRPLGRVTVDADAVPPRLKLHDGVTPGGLATGGGDVDISGKQDKLYAYNIPGTGAPAILRSPEQRSRYMVDVADYMSQAQLDAAQAGNPAREDHSAAFKQAFYVAGVGGTVRCHTGGIFDVEGAEVYDAQIIRFNGATIRQRIGFTQPSLESNSFVTNKTKLDNEMKLLGGRFIGPGTMRNPLTYTAPGGTAPGPGGGGVLRAGDFWKERTLPPLNLATLRYYDVPMIRIMGQHVMVENCRFDDIKLPVLWVSHNAGDTAFSGSPLQNGNMMRFCDWWFCEQMFGVEIGLNDMKLLDLKNNKTGTRSRPAMSCVKGINGWQIVGLRISGVDNQILKSFAGGIVDDDPDSDTEEASVSRNTFLERANLDFDNRDMWTVAELAADSSRSNTAFSYKSDRKGRGYIMFDTVIVRVGSYGNPVRDPTTGAIIGVTYPYGGDYPFTAISIDNSTGGRIDGSGISVDVDTANPDIVAGLAAMGLPPPSYDDLTVLKFSNPSTAGGTIRDLSPGPATRAQCTNAPASVMPIAAFGDGQAIWGARAW